MFSRVFTMTTDLVLESTYNGYGLHRRSLFYIRNNSFFCWGLHPTILFSSKD